MKEIKVQVKQNPREEKRRKLAKEAKEQTNFYLELLKKKPEFTILKPKEREFVVNYVLYQGDWEKALIMSGMTSEYYYKLGARYCQKEKIQVAIELFRDIVLGDKIVEIANKLIDQNERIAFTKRAKYFDAKGQLKEGLTLDDLGEDDCLVDSIERKWYGKDADKEVIIIKWADRGASRRELTKLLEISAGTFKKTNINKQQGVLFSPPELMKEEWENL